MRVTYKVENVGKDERKFLDRHKSVWVYLKPKECIDTTCPPEEASCWSIEPKEESITKKKKNKSEED